MVGAVERPRDRSPDVKRDRLQLLAEMRAMVERWRGIAAFARAQRGNAWEQARADEREFFIKELAELLGDES